MAIGTATAIGEREGGKVILATRQDTGADVYCWIVETGSGEWISEFGVSVPSWARKHGLQSKEALVAPNEAKRYPTPEAATAGALRAAQVWVQDQARSVNGAAGALLDRLYQHLLALELGPQPPAPLVETAVSRKTGDDGSITDKGKKKRRQDRDAGAAPVADSLAEGFLPPGTPVEQIPLDRIDVLPGNPEPDPDVIRAILKHGQDEPVIVIAPGQLAPGDQLPHAWRSDHYVLVAGATRLAAAQRAGRQTIEARVRTEPVSYADAIAFALRSNTGRREVTTDELAGRVQQLAGCGLDDEAIATKIGADRSEVNLLRRFNALPTLWKQRVRRYERSGGDDPDSLSWAAAKALLPYVGIPAILDEVERQWGIDAETLRTRDAFREEIANAIELRTRPATPGAKFFDHDFYREMKVPGKIEDLPDADREKLQIVDLPVGKNGRKEPRATCDGKTYCDVLGIRTAAEGDDAAPGVKQPELSPAEQRARDREADQELRERIWRPGGLRELGMRIACSLSAKLQPGSDSVRDVHRWLSAAARDTEQASHLDPAMWHVYAAQIWCQRAAVKVPKVPTRKGWNRPDKEQYGQWLVQVSAAVVDRGEYHDGVEAEFCRVVLWPQTEAIKGPYVFAPGVWPDRVPAIDQDLLDAIRRELDVDANTCWSLGIGANAAPAAVAWYERFLDAHDRRQLAVLGREVVTFAKGDDFATAAEFAAAKKSEQKSYLLAAHRRGAVRLPQVLKKSR